MTTSYIYSINSDFTSATTVNLIQLTNMINSNTTIDVNCEEIFLDGDAITINFLSSLDTVQEAELVNVIHSYTFIDIAPIHVSKSHGALVSNDLDNPGDYFSISEAFAAGEQSVYVKNGVYYESSDIIIGNFGQLIGESTGGVSIVLLNGHSIKADGSGGIIESAGTISITHNTNIVTGIGTTFTNLAPGNFILIGTNYHNILSIESDTSLTMITTYQGITIINDAYYASAMHSGIIINNIIIISPNMLTAGVGLYFRSIRHSYISAIVITKTNPNIILQNCSDISISDIIVYTGNGDGIEIYNCHSVLLNTINVFNNTDNGVYINNCVDVIISGCAGENNSSNGFMIVNSKFVKIINSVLKYNNNNGIHIDANSHGSIMSNNTIYKNKNVGIISFSSNNTILGNIISTNGMYGIQAGVNNAVTNNQIISNTDYGIFLPASSDMCIISNNQIDICDSNCIQVESSECLISNNIITNSLSNGIYINGSDNYVTGNIVKLNDETGILIGSLSLDNIISLNIAKNNTTSNLVDNGTNTVLLNNNI